MPRASYYAPVGNPTIPDKIPKHSLDFEFVYCGDSLETTQKLRTEAICRIIVVDLIVMVLSYYSGARLRLPGVCWRFLFPVLG